MAGRAKGKMAVKQPALAEREPEAPVKTSGVPRRGACLTNN
jgi:hypothetical protein